MEHVFQFLLLFFIDVILSNAAGILQNPDFEIPPINISQSATSKSLLLNNSQNSIPGWSFSGTVWYVSSPENGHAIQLGQNGSISQTFKGTDDYLDYILTFNLAALNEDCFNNFTAVNVSVLDPIYYNRSQIFSLGRNLSRKLWLSYGFNLGSWGSKKDSIDLEIKSVEQNFTCWPVVDNFILKSNGMPRFYEGNDIPNGDFEIGPPLIKNTSEGILLNEEPDPDYAHRTPVQGWKILGTVKYIDSKHFKIPQGNAAIQRLSGYPSGIRSDYFFQMKQTYTLNFTIGDANDSCVGNLIVFLQVGNDVSNFTLQSNGTGSAFWHSYVFSIKSEWPRDTPIVFYRFNETWASDGVLCGPILDRISLYASDLNSSSGKKELWFCVVVFSLFVGLTILV